MRKGLVMLLVIAAALAAASPKLRIGYYGHSMFEIVLPSGTRIITDPFEPATGPEFPAGVEADVVLMSHDHTDHTYHAGLGGSPDLIFWANGTSHGIDFTATATKHLGYPEEGRNHIMSWETEGFKFAHMGDYGDEFSTEDSAALANTTFLFIPVGGFYTIDAEQANDIINNVGPLVVFPMHYRTPDHSSDYNSLSTLAEANVSFTFPIVEHDPWIAIDPDNLPDGPIIWEPDYSGELPGDLEVTGVDATESSPYMIGVNVVNNSARDAGNVPLILNVLDGTDIVYADTEFVSVSGDDEIFHQFGPWMPPESKTYTLFAEIVYPADEVPPNDTLSCSVYMEAVTEAPFGETYRLNTRWTDEGVLYVEYAFAGKKAELGIYDITGQEVASVSLAAGNQRTFYYQPQVELPCGIYFARLVATQRTMTDKCVKTK